MANLKSRRSRRLMVKVCSTLEIWKEILVRDSELVLQSTWSRPRLSIYRMQRILQDRSQLLQELKTVANYLIKIITKMTLVKSWEFQADPLHKCYFNTCISMTTKWLKSKVLLWWNLRDSKHQILIEKMFKRHMIYSKNM